MGFFAVEALEGTLYSFQELNQTGLSGLFLTSLVQ